MVDVLNVVVIWRDKQLHIDVNRISNVQEFGSKLQKLTNVKPDTLRLLVPQSRNKGSKMLSPFSEEHSNLSLLESSILEGKPIRMMGAIDSEVKEVSESSIKSDTRIIGFEEEEKRLRQRSTSSSRVSLKLPQGDYVFCEFRTLQLPGIELNPPPSEALKRMHMLACDPGIIAIMNKHKWRVGIMTEMAPEGYVGVSPMCVLGFNKNHGEEISLRLRTDDLKGFRKYESIKKTLLHELAHMVYSEHDANFYALNKQLNKEATSLDWTKSASHSLTGLKISNYEDDLDFERGSYNMGIKLGGNSKPLPSARASSAVAAYSRLLNSSSEDHNQPSDKGQMPSDQLKATPDDRNIEPIPADTLIMKDYANTKDKESHPDDMLTTKDDVVIRNEEPDIDDSITRDSQTMFEPDPDNSTLSINQVAATYSLVGANGSNVIETEPENSLSTTEDEYMELDRGNNPEQILSSNETEPNPHMDDLGIVEDPTSAISSRIQIAIKKLRSEAPPVEANSAIQTLVKIIRNVMEHPNEVKFKRLRKNNPLIQRNLVNYEAAMEVLKTIGFYEDVIPDSSGRKETYLVLKRDDPGLLWLAKSSLEISMA